MNSSTYQNDATMLAIVGTVFVFVLLFIVIAYAVFAYLLGRIFKKAGLPAWKAWVPVYNNWKLFEIGDQPGWWSLVFFIPIVNVAAAVFMFIAMHKVGQKLGKEDWFVILAIFVPIVWLIWLAFDDSKWHDTSGKNQLSATPNSPRTPPHFVK